MTLPEIIVHRRAPALWNRWVAQGLGGPNQTSHYAAYWQEMWGYKPLFLVAGDPDRPDGILLAYEYSPLSRLLRGRPGAEAVRALTWPALRCVASRFGPVVLNQEKRTATVLALIKAAASRAGLGRGRYFYAALQHYLDQEPEEELIQGLAGLGGRLIKGLTPLLAVEEDLDKVLMKVHRQARKAKKQADKQGLAVEVLDGGDEQAAGMFIDLADQVKGAPSLGPALPRLTARHLAREEFSVRYFICRLEGEPVGGIGLHAFGGVAMEIAAWTGERSWKERLNTGDALKWAIIEWCAANGVRIYDLMGVSPDPRTSKEEGIARFKKKWSSQLRPIYSLRTRAAVTPP